MATVNVKFAGAVEAVGLYEIPGPAAVVRHFVLDHALFAPQGPGRIYFDDGPDAPFATDASKFALFCASVATVISEYKVATPNIIHLHDWPTALFLALREFDPAYGALKRIRTVFTIHNLAVQGVRPLKGDKSSLQAWFPELSFREQTVTDPRWLDCVNPMATAIRLADGLNTVSPSYAREILEPNAPERGYFGGEGLEADLKSAAARGRLAGILNGCPYEDQIVRRPGWDCLLETMRFEVRRWIARETPMVSAHYLADQRLSQLSGRGPDMVLTSVGRIAAQKTQLFRESSADGVSALQAILATLGGNGLFVMLGSGDREYETFLTEVAANHDNFLFLRGYSEALSESLYAGGNLFLMPSSFEPCGISQMLAMRAGQLCVVHAVGGLGDTVRDNVTGFVFNGETRSAQATNFVTRVAAALALRKSSGERWRKMELAAAAMRFSWDASAAAYEQDLYGIDGS